MEQQHHLNDLTIDTAAAQELREIAKWGKFLSIIGFIFCALIVLIGIFAGSLMGMAGGLSGNAGMAAGMGGAMAVIYIIFALIYFFPCLFLFQSSVRMKDGLNANDQHVLNQGLAKLKACFRYWGIMTIIILAIYALLIVVMVVAGAGASAFG